MHDESTLTMRGNEELHAQKVQEVEYIEINVMGGMTSNVTSLYGDVYVDPVHSSSIFSVYFNAI